MLNPSRVPVALQEQAEWCPHLTLAQLRARAAFDLDATTAALPKGDARSLASADAIGNAGTRLREHLRATIPDDLLREFAHDVLGAQRCSDQYLEALRVVLGNQAHADRCGYVLEMNTRVSFASERTMRTLVGQIKAAGIGYGRSVALGSHRRQLVRCFGRARPACGEVDAAAELEQMYRQHESDGPLSGPGPAILPEDVPY